MTKKCSNPLARAEHVKTYTLPADMLLDAMEETFHQGGKFPLEITGWSMRPLLRHGRDTVLLEPFCREDTRRGSILLYERHDGHLVLHRVRKCQKDGYCMNGDAQVPCEFISAEQVRAQASEICRRGRCIPCGAPGMRLWDALWYPTRPLRPLIFQVSHKIRKTFL